MMMRKISLTLIAVAVLIPLCILSLQRPMLTGALNDLTTNQVVEKSATQSQVAQQPTVIEKKPTEVKTPKERPKKTVEKKKNVKKKPSKRIIVIDPSHQQLKDVSLEYVAPKSDVKRAKQLASATGVVTAQKEYRLTMTMAKKLKKQLQKKGYKVVLTRTKHDVNISNKQRAKKANEIKADLVISLHADGGKSYQRGFYVMTASKKATPAYYKQSKRQATAILKAVAKHEKIYYPGAFEREDVALFNYAKAPALSIQLGFLTNVKDDQKLASDAYLDILVKWIANGVKTAK